MLYLNELLYGDMIKIKHTESFQFNIRKNERMTM